MDNNLQRKEITDVIHIIDELIPLLDESERKMKSARNWGILDIFGGDTLTGLVKHWKISSAGKNMNRINILLHDLQRELKDVTIPSGMSMETGTFATFADFLFDGLLADVYMQTKIARSLDEIRELKRKLKVLSNQMQTLLNQC